MNDISYTPDKIKVSVILSVLNSHEIVRRQIEHFKKLNLPDDWEFIIMDDGSSPPLLFPDHGLKNLNFYRTGITIPWTQPYAKNVAVQIAKGEYILITDIDHFFPESTIEVIKNFTGDKLMFRRRHAILDENGNIKGDKKSLVEYGMPAKRYDKRRGRVNYHTNSFLMKRWIFKEMGGFGKKYWFDGVHSLEDSSFYTQYNRAVRRGKYKPAEISKNRIFVFPAPSKNVKVYFHDLIRKIPKTSIGE
jgi:glycosyltransferase involved in cell wall biosynthesis